MEHQFYKVEEAAKILNTKTSTVRTYCREGKIPAMKIGRGYRIAKEDLERWLRLQKQNSTSFDEEHQRLLDTEAKYKDLFENASDGIILFDTKGLLVLANPKAYEMSGYTRKEAEGKHFARFIHPEDLPLATERFMSRMAGEDVPSKYEVRYLCKDGQIIPVEISSNVVTKEGEPSGVQIILRDMSEHKKAVKRIRFLSKLLETSPISVIATDEKEEIIYINSATRQLFGYKEEELIGRNPGMLNAEPEANGIQNEITSTIRRGKVWKGEVLNRKKNGDLFDIQLSVYQLLDENGDFVALVGFQEDISERKKTEEALKVQAQILQDMFEGVNVANQEGIITFTNPKFDEMFGYEQGELIGKHLSVLNSIEPEENDRLISEIVKQLEKEGHYSGEFRNVRKDGTFFRSYARISALKLPGETLFISVQEGITEHKKAEEALQESEEK